MTTHRPTQRPFSFHGTETVSVPPERALVPAKTLGAPPIRRTLGDVASASADAQVQLAALATFFAGVNSGQAPAPAQLAAASAATGQIQNDLIQMGATPTTTAINQSGGVSKMQAGLVAGGALLLGVILGHAFGK